MTEEQIDEIMRRACSVVEDMISEDGVFRPIAESEVVRRMAFIHELNAGRIEGDSMLGSCGDTLQDLRLELERRMLRGKSRDPLCT